MTMTKTLRSLVIVLVVGALHPTNAQIPNPFDVPLEVSLFRVDEVAACAGLYRLLATRQTSEFERDKLREKDSALQLFLDVQFNKWNPDPSSDDYDRDRSEHMIRTAAYAFSLATRDGVNWPSQESTCNTAYLDPVAKWLETRSEFRLQNHRWSWK